MINTESENGRERKISQKNITKKKGVRELKKTEEYFPNVNVGFRFVKVHDFQLDITD